MKFPVKRTLLRLSPDFMVGIYKKTFTRRKTEKRNALESFSENGEDLAIHRFFPNIKTGFYVDVGAFHPIKKSNTYRFYKMGWHGINIEANSDHIELFKLLRKRDLNLNIAVSDKKETLTYYKFNTQAVNTFNKEHADYWSEKEGSKLLETIEVETLTLKQVLDKYLPANQKIHFMSIDVEGMDIKVLKSNDWNKYRPIMVLAEDNDHDLYSFSESDIYSFLTDLGYSLWCITGPTMIFIDKKN